VNARIPCAVLFLLLCASPLCAEDPTNSPAETGLATNLAAAVMPDFTGQVEQTSSAPALAVDAATNSAPATN
jgi:hypothetical protein